MHCKMYVIYTFCNFINTIMKYNVDQIENQSENAYQKCNVHASNIFN